MNALRNSFCTEAIISLATSRASHSYSRTPTNLIECEEEEDTLHCTFLGKMKIVVGGAVHSGKGDKSSTIHKVSMGDDRYRSNKHNADSMNT